jgi:hypothetical protein
MVYSSDYGSGGDVQLFDAVVCCVTCGGAKRDSDRFGRV